MRYVFPADYGDNCVLVPIDAALVPMVAGALLHFQQRGYWITETDYQQGYNAFAELQASMANNCLTELIESNNRLYRLIDASLNGTTYTADGATPPVVSPAIPAAPGAVDGVTVGLRRQLLDAQGILPSGWPLGIGDAPATVADVVKALRVASPSDTDQVQDAFDALNDAAEVSTIAGTVGTFLTSAADGTLEAGSLMLQAMSTVGNMAMLRLLLEANLQVRDRIDRLITSLDGGGGVAPATNVISELQAANEKLV